MDRLYFHFKINKIVATHFLAMVASCSSLTALRTSHLCRSGPTLSAPLKSERILRRSFVSSPCARKADTTDEYADTSAK